MQSRKRGRDRDDADDDDGGKRAKTTGRAEVDGDHRAHREHLVSDGHEIKEARVLQSLSDGHTHVKSLEVKILHALHVPPSAVGLNQNSERLASR